jgi:hypothetical protein
VSSSDPEAVDGERLQHELETRLAIDVRKEAREETTPALVNVHDIYSGESGTRRVLAVVFVNSAATNQILGRGSPSLPGMTIVRYRNAVVLYEHEPGSLIGRGELIAALRGAASS